MEPSDPLVNGGSPTASDSNGGPEEFDADSTDCGRIDSSVLAQNRRHPQVPASARAWLIIINVRTSKGGMTLRLLRLGAWLRVT